MTTNKRLDAEDAIVSCLKHWRNPFYPSFRDVAKVTGIPLGTVHALARALREQGRITFTDHISRSMRITGG